MRVLLCGALLASFATVVGAAEEDKLYKWVDENGNVTYQDQPPPTSEGQVETIVRPSAETTSPSTTVPNVDVVLYAIDVCDACDLVREALQERQIPFEEKNANDDPEIQTELKEVAGVLSVPVLLIGDDVFRGYNKELILNELEEAGFSTALRESGESRSSSGEGMTPEEVEQAARDAFRAEDAPFAEDDGFSTLDEDIFVDDEGDTGFNDDITELEEIPEDERIDVSP